MNNSTTMRPPPVAWHGPMVWSGHKLQLTTDWITPISEAEIKNIRLAISNTMASAKPIATLVREDFEFGVFGEKLLEVRKEILHGRGFALLRGLPDTGWSNEELVHAYWGIGAWLGDAVSQNAKAHLLGHVIDQRLAADEQTRLYQTNKAQPFHSDSCDIVGLLCLHTAKTGGASSIASSSAIHNALLETEPNLLAELYAEFQCDRYGEIPAGKQGHYAVHIFQ